VRTPRKYVDRRVRPEHAPEGDPCARCGVSARAHRRFSKRARRKLQEKKTERAHAKKKSRIIGVDGEGHDTKDGRHIYTYLAAVDEHGVTVAEAYNPAGLSHEECISRVILKLPKNALSFWFMGGYDVTMILRDLPPYDIYTLMRPEERVRYVCSDTTCGKQWDPPDARCPRCHAKRGRSYRPKHVYNGRGYDWFSGLFSVSTLMPKTRKTTSPKWETRTIWDSFKFFQSSFVKAITEWKVGTGEQQKRIAAMKDKRGAFDVVDPEEIKRYCKEECHLLAMMMRKVLQAHESLGWNLRDFYGAGSTAAALLNKYGVKKYKGKPFHRLPRKLQRAIMRAFFGGRFENSAIGRFDVPVYNKDISSAYPYAQATELPCLACGEWKHVQATGNRLQAIIRKADLALVKFHVKKVSAAKRKTIPWMPLPFRDKDGSIVYPTNFWGWAWRPEFDAAKRGWPDLVEHAGEAWVYTTTKRCRAEHKPFAFIPSCYVERNKIGKDGPGIVLKLGMNATYGKTAQSKGDAPPFQNWIWAGMTTATTRGQLLDAIASAKDRWNVIGVATDGIFALENLDLPKPEPTGTDLIVGPEGKEIRKPLGGWETKVNEKGMFFAKPGLYLPLDVEKPEDLKSRGLGRRELFEHRAAIMDGFAKWDRKDVDYTVRAKSRRFFGAKSSILFFSMCVDVHCKKMHPGLVHRCEACSALCRPVELARREGLCVSCAAEMKKHGREWASDAFAAGFPFSPNDSLCGKCAKSVYGMWREVPIEIAFDPHPKRERAIAQGGAFARLHIRDAGGKTSSTYKGETTPEGKQAAAVKEMALEQPDADPGWEDAG